MISPALLRLVWKEYRTQRNLWIVLVVAGLVWQGIAWCFVSQPPSSAPYHIIGAAIVIPIMFVLGSCALLFASEKEERTWNLLRTFPISPSVLFAAKFGFSLVCLVAIFVIVWSPAWLLPAMEYPNNVWYAPFGERDMNWMKWGLATLAILAWGGFYSLATGRALATALLSPLTVVALSPLPYTVIGATTIVVAAVDFWMTGRWLADKPIPFSARLRRGVRARSAPTRFLFVNEASTPWKRGFIRLVWLEWRNSQSFLRWSLAVGAIVVLLYSLNSLNLPLIAPGLTSVYLAVVPYLAGVWAFHGEQLGLRYRIGAERGLAAGPVWLSKHVAWLSVAIAVPLLLLVFDWLVRIVGDELVRTAFNEQTVWQNMALLIAMPQIRSVTDPWEIVFHMLFWIVWAYSVGQFVSLLFRRAITAIVVGLLPSLAVLELTLLAKQLFEASFTWCLGWLTAALLAATLARTSDWMLERKGLRRWVKVVALIVVPGLVVLFGFIVYRVTEIPSMDVSRKVRRPYEPPSYLDRESMATVHRTYAPNVSPKADDASRPADPAVERLRAELSKINLDGSEGPEPLHDRDPWRNPILYLERAKQLTARAELDDALVQFIRWIRAFQHVAGRWGGSSWEGLVSLRAEHLQNEFSNWLAHPQQTSARVRFALECLEVELRPPASLQSRILADSIARQRRLAEDWSELTSELRGRGQMEVVWTRWLFPWEKERMLRLLEAVATARLVEAHQLDDMARWEHMDLAAWMDDLRQNDLPNGVYFNDKRYGDFPPRTDLVPPWKWLSNRSEPLHSYVSDLSYQSHLRSMEAAVLLECQRRAFLVVCALVAFRLEQGELPTSLDDLVPNYLTSVPIDLWSGRELNYRSDGFAYPLNGTSIAGVRPVVWSAGPRSGRPETVMNPPPLSNYSGPVTVASDRFVRRKNNDYSMKFPSELTFAVP